ncbi:hypothetical protein L1049_011672 [Liquidambar formosana]|uniref:VQ domain-containing protein n=1 Tax=Liquidambar formosana TaxID=63359 RepID=A0AAP0RYQ6_LIQFO
MEEMMKPNCSSSPFRPAAMHTDSHIISKFKPKVRIIHIFAPEIIKTDAANFRELVQRLTGKPSEQIEGSSRKKRTNVGSKSMKVLQHGFPTTCFVDGERIKEEEEEMASGFLDGFTDLDGFIQELTEFPSRSSSHMDDVFGEIRI